jgi:hypothetical protein
MALNKTFREFSDLIGEQVSAVCFVRDYVEIHFDGPVLRAFYGPVIEVDGNRFEFPEAGSRDALCSMIDAEIVAVQFDENEYFRMSTARGHHFTIPLNPDPPTGKECLNFNTPNPANSQFW